MTTWLPLLVAFVAPTAAVFASHLLTSKKLDVIHVLVNSRLQLALDEIEKLKRER